MPDRQIISSGTKWEDIVGYSRAVKIGSLVFVAGTTAVDEQDQVVGHGDPYAQAKFIFKKIEKALRRAGATMQDVVRTRMYVTDIRQWEQIARAHGEFFGDIKPATTMVEVKALISPDLLLEVEVTAFIHSSSNNP